MPNQDENGEANLEWSGEADVPLGVVRARVEVPIEATANGRLEEEEIVVDKEKQKGPALEEAIEVSRGHDGEPGNGSGNDDDLLKGRGEAERVKPSAVKAVEAEDYGGDPGPEDPGPTEVGPEERVE